MFEFISIYRYVKNKETKNRKNKKRENFKFLKLKNTYKID